MSIDMQITVDVMQARIDKLTQLGQQQYDCLAINVLCTCKRKHLYSGPVVKVCTRCVTMILWEKKDGKDSPTEKRTQSVLI